MTFIGKLNEFDSVNCRKKQLPGHKFIERVFHSVGWIPSKGGDFFKDYSLNFQIFSFKSLKVLART